jgi:hypothetical protein
MDAIFRCGVMLIPYTGTNGQAGKGQTRFVPVKTLGAIKTNLLRFYNEFHAAGIGHGQGK